MRGIINMQGEEPKACYLVMFWNGTSKLSEENENKPRIVERDIQKLFPSRYCLSRKISPFAG